MEKELTGPLTISLLKRKPLTKCFKIHLRRVAKFVSSIELGSLSNALLTGVKIVKFPASSNSWVIFTQSMIALNVEKASPADDATCVSFLTSSWVAVFGTIWGEPDEKSNTKSSSSSILGIVVVVILCVVVGLFVIVVVGLLVVVCSCYDNC